MLQVMDQESSIHDHATETLPIRSTNTTDSRCLLTGCQGNDGAGHILLECTHADMKKRHIARHDAMMQMLMKELTTGSRGSHYLIADVGTVDTLKSIGVHSKQIPKFVLPDPTFNTQYKTSHLAVFT